MPKALVYEGPIREAVGVFEDAESLQNAIDALMLEEHFDRDDLGLLAREDVIEAKLGYKPHTAADAAAEPNVPRTFPVTPEERGNAKGGLIAGFTYLGAVGTAGLVVASGGALAIAIGSAVAAGGAGAAVGGTLAHWLDKRHAKAIEQQVDYGGLVLWVRTADPAQEGAATRILEANGAKDVHIHELRNADVAA